MKFTYTHITKDYTEITEYKVDKNNKIKSKNISMKEQIRILQEKLEKYKIYYNSSYQYKDYDMSDYYKSRIKELKLKINKII